MSAVEAPAFTAERDGRQIRAFGGASPDATWFALGDLAAALTASHVDRVELLAGLAGGALGLQLRDVVTPDGPLVLVDHRSTFRLFATIRALQDGPATLPSAAALWEDAAVGAIVASTLSREAGEAPP